jgi:hypothetical protein
MTTFASEYLATVQDIVYEGSLPYFGLLAAALTVGQKLNITGSTYPTGWDSFAIPIIAVELEYRERSGATHYLTTVTFSNRRSPFSGAALKRPAVLGQPFGIGLTELRASPQPPVPSAAGQGSPAGAASDQQDATDSNSGDSPAPAAALGDDPAPSEALAGSLPEGSQASPTDPLPGPTESAPAPLSSGATPPTQTGLADEPADDERRPVRRVRFAEGKPSQFVRNPPRFRPRAADTFARSHSRPDVYSVSASGDDAEPGMLTDQDDDTKTTEANLTASSDDGIPNDPIADTVAGILDVGMRGSARAGRAAYRPKGPSMNPRLSSPRVKFSPTHRFPEFRTDRLRAELVARFPGSPSAVSRGTERLSFGVNSVVSLVSFSLLVWLVSHEHSGWRLQH